jgi:hypothetical protein
MANNFWPEKESKTNNFKKLFVIFVLLFSFGLSFGMKYVQISKRPDLLSLDPMYFAADTKAYLDGGNINRIGYAYPVQGEGYPKGIIYLTAGIHKFFNIPVDMVYQWWGPIITSLFGIFLFLATYRTFGVIASLVGAWLYQFSPYILTRGMLTVPENLAVLIFIFIIYSLLNRKWLLALLGFLVMALVHNSVFYFVPSLILILILIDLPKRYKTIIGILLIALILVISKFIPLLSTGEGLSHQLFSSDIYFLWPKFKDISKDLNQVLIITGAVGFLWVGFKYIFGPKPLKTQTSIILSLGLPFLFLLFFFHGQSKISFGPILPERFLIYTALMAALSTAFLFKEIFSFLKRGYLKCIILIITIVAIFIYQPRKIAPWFWVFSPGEAQAASWLQNTPKDSYVISQYLLTWLTRSEGQRMTISSPLDQPIDQLRNIVPNGHNAYIFISRDKEKVQYQADFSDGTKTQVGYTDALLQPVDEKLYKELPKVFENNFVAIYRLK